MRRCEYCGSFVPDDKNKCEACGAWCTEEVKKPSDVSAGAQAAATDNAANVKTPTAGKIAESDKFSLNNGTVKALIVFLVCLFLGTFGLHRFMQGKIFTGLLWLVTLGLLGIGYIADVIVTGVRFFKSLAMK